MNTLEFLRLVLPPVGEYYLLSGRDQLKTTTAATIEGLSALIEAARSKQKNVFIGLAGFRPGTDRKKPNVVGKQCFYIDLDVGNDPKKYASKQEAFDGLKAFLSSSGFPAPSLIVDSGGGLHAYWLTSELVLEAEWTSMAQGLKQLCAKHGLKHDVSVVADSSRILRVPGTFNWKDPSSPRECKVVKNTNRSYSVEHLRKFLPRESNVVPLKPGMFDGAGSFVDVIATSTQPRYMKHILNECAVAKHTHDTHGAGDDYNQWFSMLTLLLYCEDGESFVHPFSNGHPDYSSSTVTAKWRSRLADKEINAVHGATTCETFHSMHPEICEACPHWNSPDRGVNWSSPLHFGLPPVENALPFPYLELSNGNTGKRSIGADGEVEIVHAFDGIVKHLTVYDFGTQGIAVEWVHALPGGRTIKVSATAEELVDQRAFNKSVAATLIVDDRGAKEIRTMAQAWSKQIQARRGEVKAPGAFGWVQDGKRTGFRLGDVVYWADGVDQTVSPCRGMDMISAKGSYDAWKQMATAFLRADHIESEVLLAASFAAPLMAMSHVEGAILSAVSLQSGTGKTTAMRMGQAVWGNPSHAMFSLSDTPNSIFHRMGKYNNLPAMWDDLRIPDTRREARSTVDMIYQITQGREKSRMTSGIDLRGVNSWKTLLICSSNTGLSPYIELVDQGGSAAQHRMLEFEVAPLDPSKCCDPSMFNDLNVHYGHAGIAYVKWVLANYAACKELFAKNRDAIQTKLKARPEDRFTIAAITSIYTAAQLVEAAGILQFNKAGILKFLIAAFQKRRVEIADVSSDVGGQNSLVELIAVFILEHQLNTVWMRKFPKPGPGVWDNTNLLKPADREALMAIAVEDGEIRINKSVFDSWGRAKGRVAIGRQMTGVPGVVVGRKNVTSHLVGAGSAAPHCYAIKNVPETAMLFSEIPNCGGN